MSANSGTGNSVSRRVDSISVIMPVYNEDEGVMTTLAALGSAGAFSELIVIDASTDLHCRQILAGAIEKTLGQGAFDHHQLITHARPGRAAQMNAGAAVAKGDCLLFLHADTHLPIHADSRIKQALIDGHRWGRFNVRFDDDTGWLWWVARMMNARSHLFGICTGDQAIFVRRDLFEELGGYADIALMEDINISKRLKRHGRAARIIQPVVTSGRRWHQEGPVRTILLMWLLRLGYWLGLSPATLVHYYRNTRRRSVDKT